MSGFKSETLRQAAALMRERAMAAPAGSWGHREAEGWNRDSRRTLGTFSVIHDGRQEVAIVRGFSTERESIAPHIASWHPGVALTVADLLEAHANQVDAGPKCDDPRGCYDEGILLAFDLADAYLIATTPTPAASEGQVAGGQ